MSMETGSASVAASVVAIPSLALAALLRLARQPGGLPHEPADWTGRGAHPHLAGRDVLHHPGGGGDAGAGADLEVVGDAGPAAEHRAVADGHAARDAGVRRQQAEPSQADVVGDL